MSDDLESMMIHQTPTADRPLLGVTVLMVEDSRFASEAMRLLCLRSGARIRRADSLKSAHRHLAVYRPSVIIVDLGLPDGSGAELIRELTSTKTRVGVILGTSGSDDGEQISKDAGAEGYLEKPIESLANFQQAILKHLPAESQPKGLRTVTQDKISPDPLALHDDLVHIADVLTTSATDDRAIDYVAQFLTGVARIAHDNPLEDAVAQLTAHRASGKPFGSDVAQIAGMVQDRLEQGPAGSGLSAV